MDEPHRHNKIAKTQIEVLPLDRDYLPDVLAAYNEGYNITPEYYDDPEVMTLDKYHAQLDHFPEGQFMALDVLNDTVAGVASSMIVDWNPDTPLLEQWVETTDYGRLTTHNPNGEWLYGVDNVVLARYRGHGIGGRLMKARYNIAKRYNLRGMVAGSLIIDYYKVADTVPVDEYVADVVAGRRWDTNLSKQIKKGMRVFNVIPNYLNDMPESCNYGVTIVWDNPDYRPTKSLPQRQRAAKTIRPTQQTKLR